MRIFTVLFVLHFSKSEEVFVESTLIMAVKFGEMVTLHCNLRHKEETLWLGQRCDEVPFIIISAGNGLPDKYFMGYNSRFSTAKHSVNGSFSLQIQNISVSDLGLFYCATNFGVPMLIGSRYKLIHTESVTSPTPESLACATPYPTPLDSSACPGLSWYWVLVLCPVCAVLAVLLYCTCVRWRNCHKSHTNSRIAKFKTQKEARDESEHRLQDEDQVVIYSTVCISADTQAKTRGTQH